MNIAAILSDATYPELKRYVLQHTGLGYYETKDEDFAARLARRLSSLNLTRGEAYLQILRETGSGEMEMHRLVSELTVGETYFFRQEEHFEALRKVILPDLLSRKERTRSITIWSAGCATGAEPYSLSLLLHTEFQQRIEGWNVSILGTDINMDFLERARQARFAEWALRETPAAVKTACFLREGKEWRLRPEYRKGVTFRYHNLAEPGGPGEFGAVFDLILCRNVIIYFSRELARSAVDQFHQSLIPGGWLLVGYAEPNMELFPAFETVSFPNATVYRKPGAGSPPIPPPLPSSPVVDWQPPKLDGAAEPALPDPPSVPAAPAAKPEAKHPEVHPEPPIPTLEHARMLADSGHWSAAAEATRQLIAANALNAPAHFILGLILEHAGRGDEAIAAFRRAIYLDRSFVLAHYHLGTLLEGHREMEPARKAFRNVQQLLRHKRGDEMIAHGDSVTIDELRELTSMHLELLADE